MAAAKRLNLHDNERTAAAKLCELAMVAKLKMAAIHCELVEATILNLAGFERAAAGQNLGDFELTITMAVVAMGVMALMLWAERVYRRKSRVLVRDWQVQPAR